MKALLTDLFVGLALAMGIILVVLFSSFHSTFVYRGF